MKKLVILIFVFFSFTLSAKEIVFKVTNSNRINLTKGQFIRVAPMYSDGNVNFGELQFYGNTSFNVNFFLKKNLTDFMLFLKFDETYDLYSGAERWQRIQAVMKSLNEKTQDERNQLLAKAHTIALHNRQWLHNIVTNQVNLTKHDYKNI